MPELMDGTWISDQEDQEGYLGYDDTHCEHGTFVGGWAGPDYMCHWCEQGISVEELRATREHNARLKARYDRVRAAWHARIKRYDNEGEGSAIYDSIVRLGTWLGRRDSWK